MSLQKRLEKALHDKNIKPKTLSIQAGLNETAIRDILKGRSKNPRSDTLRKIASALNIRPEWLLDGFGTMNEINTVHSHVAENSIDTNISPTKTPISGKIPVFATSSMEPLWPYQFDFDHPIDKVDSFPLIENVKGAHALYMADNKMAPRYFIGETLYIHPARPVQIGDDCLIINTKGMGLIGKLDSKDAHGAHFSFYNDESRVFVLTHEIMALSPIIGSLKT